MAIDTKEKRASVIGIVTPDSAKDAEWRRQVIGLYTFGDDLPPPLEGDVSAAINPFTMGFHIGF